FLRGREYYHIASRSNHLMARQSFARAIELDPGYARAYAGIAVCDARLRSQFGAEIPVEDILANTTTALVIDPNLAEAYAAKGFAL
ncbi:adenylate/guanylate cyclase domain-containing protein, partial [Mesorhizobium sp. M1A.T.Ca.IN.004.03.1.1]